MEKTFSSIGKSLLIAAGLIFPNFFLFTIFFVILFSWFNREVEEDADKEAPP